MIGDVVEDCPTLQAVATTLRARASRRRSTTGAPSRGARRAASSRRPSGHGLEILDRVGGGDSFASGLDLRAAAGFDLAQSGRVRRGARRTGDDHARRHLDGEPRRGRGAGRRRRAPACSDDRATAMTAIVDAHQHLWEFAEHPQTWMNPATDGAINRDFVVDDLRAAAASGRSRGDRRRPVGQRRRRDDAPDPARRGGIRPVVPASSAGPTSRRPTSTSSSPAGGRSPVAQRLVGLRHLVAERAGRRAGSTAPTSAAVFAPPRDTGWRSTSW